MEKSKFTEKSKKKCVGCGATLKENLVKKNPKAEHCYKCHKTLKVATKENPSHYEKVIATKHTGKKPSLLKKLFNLI